MATFQQFVAAFLGPRTHLVYFHMAVDTYFGACIRILCDLPGPAAQQENPTAILVSTKVNKFGDMPKYSWNFMGTL